MEQLEVRQEVFPKRKKRKTKKISKVIIIISLILVIILLVGVFAISNFLFKFAVVRQEKLDSRPPISYNSPQDEKTIKENTEIMLNEKTAWLDSSNVKEVEISSYDGLKLRADVVMPKDKYNNKWVIAIHGYHCDRTESELFGAQYGLKGYNVLAPDLKAHGKSDGKYIGMGWNDRKDILAWIDYILSIDSGARIVLHGVSMGGATVMMTVGDEALPSAVVGAVEDCGYTSAWDIFSKELKTNYHLPKFPVMNLANVLVNKKAGYDLKEASALDQVAKTNVPVLFIHGSKDDFVPTDMVKPLYDACKSEKQLYIVEGAAHAQSYKLEKEKYFDTVFSFLDENCFNN